TKELSDCLFRAGEVENQEVPDHRIERVVGERESLGVADAEVKPRVESRGEPHHFLGNVYSDNRGTAFGSSRSCVTRTSGDIEDAHTRASVDGIEQGVHQTTRDL